MYLVANILNERSSDLIVLVYSVDAAGKDPKAAGGTERGTASRQTEIESGRPAHCTDGADDESRDKASGTLRGAGRG